MARLMQCPHLVRREVRCLASSSQDDVVRRADHVSAADATAQICWLSAMDVQGVECS